MPVAPPTSRMRRSAPLLVLVALAALSWGTVSWLLGPATASGTDPSHRIAAAAADGTHDAIAPAPRATAAAAVRATPSTGIVPLPPLAAPTWAGVVLVLAAVVLANDPRRRWRAQLSGAPPVLDAHLR